MSEVYEMATIYISLTTNLNTTFSRYNSSQLATGVLSKYGFSPQSHCKHGLHEWILGHLSLFSDTGSRHYPNTLQRHTCSGRNEAQPRAYIIWQHILTNCQDVTLWHLANKSGVLEWK